MHTTRHAITPDLHEMLKLAVMLPLPHRTASECLLRRHLDQWRH